MSPIKVCLAGVSHWHAEMHLDAVRHAGAEIDCVWDENPAIARAFADAHGLTTKAFDAVLENAPDVAVLMGHPADVPRRAAALIDAGIPLVLEKPAAPTTAAIADLRDRAAARGTFVAVPFPHRFGPAMLRQTELEAKASADASIHAHFRLINGAPERYRTSKVGWMLDPEICGGGALRNLGIHGVDSVLALSDGPPVLLHATVGNLIHNEPVEDYALLVLRDARGSVFTVETGYTFATTAIGGDFEWRIFGPDATLIDRGDAAWEASVGTQGRHDLRGAPVRQRYRLFFADVVDKLGRNAPPTISLDDYARAMGLIDEAYRAAAGVK